MTDETIDAQELSNEKTDVIDSQETSEEVQEPIDAPESEPEQEEEPRELELDELPLPGDEKDTKKSDLPKWAEKRLSKKDKEINEARAQAEALKLENEKLRNSYTAPQQAAQQDALPDRDNFDSEAEYISAIVDHKNQQMMNTLIARKAEAEVREKEQSFLKTWSDSEKTGLEKWADFDEKFEVLNEKTFPSNRMMAEAIVDSPYKDDILYFLGSNPEHARKLAQLGGIQATKKIAEIESRFAARKKATSSTKAPAPLTPVKGNKGAPVKVSPEQMSQEEYEAWYKEKYKR